MKPAQVTGFFIAVLAMCYYSSFVGDLAAAETSSPTSGFGVLLVLLMLLASALLLIPSSLRLWRKTEREKTLFSGPVWLSLLALNSILTLLYGAAVLWLIFMTIRLSV